MSGFTGAWLALREAADRRACNQALAGCLARWAAVQTANGGHLPIVDLGAGTGSVLRRLAPCLPRAQEWRLLDDDFRLLSVATSPGGRRGVDTRRVRVRSAVGNLALPDALRNGVRDARLVTASALFDLVSEAWCARLLALIARPGRALYAPLIFDGRLSLDPADPADAGIWRLFLAHQRQDKGFGPALGPAAARVLGRRAAARGAVVRAGHSDWRLGPADCPLLQALLEGWARASAEMAPGATAEIDRWRRRRLRLLQTASLRAQVGHVDLLATWKARPRA